MDTPPTIPPTDIHGLIDLANLGEFRDDINAQMKALVAAVQTERGKGKLTITFDVNHDDDSGVLIRSTVTSKVPKRAAGKDHLYADATGAIFVENPQQGTLPLDEGTAESPTSRVKKALGV